MRKARQDYRQRQDEKVRKEMAKAKSIQKSKKFCEEHFLREYASVLEGNEVQSNGRVTQKVFGNILSDLKMLQELKPNEELISEAWNQFSSDVVDDAPEESVKKFCLEVFRSLSSKLPASSIYKKLAINRQSNAIGEDQIKNKIKNQVRQETT